ncbi:fimbrial protein [Pantoea agglomerans]
MKLSNKTSKIRKLIYIFSFISLWAVSHSAQARCAHLNGWGGSSQAKAITTTLPSSLAVSNNLPIGALLYTHTVRLGPAYQEYVRCDDPADWIQSRWRSGYVRAQNNYYYHPSAPGIGIRVSIATAQVNGIVPLIQYPFTTSTTLNLGPDPRIIIEFIKLSNAGGVFPGGAVIDFTALSGGQVLGSIFMMYFSAPMPIITTTCQVSNPVINVPLGDVNTSVFSRIGSVSQARNFSIQLNCDPQANVNVTVDAVADPSLAQGVLSLSALPDKASGVGIQVLQNNVPVTFGQVKRIGTSAGGLYNIPMSARYYQTQGQVNSGKANGTATFTMTYN